MESRGEAAVDAAITSPLSDGPVSCAGPSPTPHYAAAVSGCFSMAE